MHPSPQYTCRSPLRVAHLVILLIAFAFVEIRAVEFKDPPQGEPTPVWAVQITEDADPREVARSVGALYRGPVDRVRGIHRFEFVGPLLARPDDVDLRAAVRRTMDFQTSVLWSEQQVRMPLETRFVPQDPLYAEQWHLQSVGQRGSTRGKDINAEAAWERGYTGAGVTVVVVDTGTEITHPDLAPNYSAEFGRDILDGGSDPLPRQEGEAHGTAVAGIIAAARNDIYGVGIAHDARLGAVRLIRQRGAPGGGTTDSETAEALGFNLDLFPHDQVHVYNNSWGPGQDPGGPIRYGGPGSLTRTAIRDGARLGRGGLGSIYVWAAGNSAQDGDRADYDGYNNLPYTISVGALGKDGRAAIYSEPGSSVFVSAPSRGTGAGILTTDNVGMSGYTNEDMTYHFSGTSAAAPMVAGVVALMLEANPDLDWRDVQHILARTAVRTDFESPGWRQNGAGFWIHDNHGFGRVDAGAAVALAGEWSPATIGVRRTVNSGTRAVPLNQRALSQGRTLTQAFSTAENITVEHVEIDFLSTHSNWGDLEITLESPAGTVSTFSEPHFHRNSPTSWTYMSVRHWGESAQGTWRLRVSDTGPQGSGNFNSWRMRIHGMATLPNENRPPVGEDVELVTDAFPVLIDPLAGVSDPDGHPVELTSVYRPAYGTVEVGEDGLLRYSMDPLHRGRDRVGVTLSDGRGGTLRRMFTVINPTPGAVNMQVATVRGNSVEIPVLDAAFDPLGGQVFLQDFGLPRRGEVAPLGGDRLLYTPPTGFVGADRFPYTVSTSGGQEGSAWVTVIVVDEPDFILDFDGVNDVVLTEPHADFDLSDRFTIEAWIRPRGWGEYFTGFGRIFDKAKAIFFLNGFEHDLYSDRSLVFFAETVNGTSAANSPPRLIQLNTWQHVAVTYNAAATNPVVFYINGTAHNARYPIDDSPRPSTGASLVSNAADPARIGEAASGERAFEGEFAEVRVWNRVLSGSEIRQWMDARVPDSANGLWTLWDFPEGSGTTTRTRGSLQLDAVLDRPEWTVAEPPWSPFVEFFGDVADFGSGWWNTPVLGDLFGDEFPWVRHPELGWLYAAWQGGGNLWVGHEGSELGWLFTGMDLYPWIYSHARGGWIYFIESGTDAPLFFDPAAAGGFFEWRR